MEKAVKNGLGSVFFNKGENCIAAGRIFVEETIYEEFLERSVRAGGVVHLTAGVLTKIAKS